MNLNDKVFISPTIDDLFSVLTVEDYITEATIKQKMVVHFMKDEKPTEMTQYKCEDAKGKPYLVRKVFKSKEEAQEHFKIQCVETYDVRSTVLAQETLQLKEFKERFVV